MRIKKSKRGLTFSFQENESFYAGAKYRYVVDRELDEVIIIPDKDGKYQMSRKGVTHKPLVDLRNHEIREIIALARYMEVEIQEDKIVVHVIKSQVHTESLSDRELLSMLDEKENLTFEISKEDLLTKDEALMDMLRCAGLFSTKEKSDLQYVFDVASLFSGAGLLDYPFAKDDSFDIKFACDFDKSAVESYKHNIGDHILCMDMRDLDAEQVPDIDLIIGGPCCQGYSNANRADIDKETAKAKRLLIDDYIRIVLAKRPLMFVIENVPQFLTKDHGMYLEKVLTELSEYQITYQVVEDWALGGYTKRKRMLLIGSRIGKIVIPDVALTSKKTVGDALRKVTSDWIHYKDVTQARPDTVEKMKHVRPGHNYKDIPEMADLDRHSNVYRRLAMDEPGVTITNWRKVNLMPPVGNRILTVAEAEALMGLPGTFRVFGSLNDRQQQIGNGVTQAIAHFIKSIIKNALCAFANEKLAISYSVA